MSRNGEPEIWTSLEQTSQHYLHYSQAHKSITEWRSEMWLALDCGVIHIESSFLPPSSRICCSTHIWLKIICLQNHSEWFIRYILYIERCMTIVHTHAVNESRVEAGSGKPISSHAPASRQSCDRCNAIFKLTITLPLWRIDCPRDLHIDDIYSGHPLRARQGLILDVEMRGFSAENYLSQSFIFHRVCICRKNGENDDGLNSYPAFTIPEGI